MGIENEVRVALGMKPLTRYGNVSYSRKLIRPIATAVQERRRQTLGATWQRVIEMGLAALECPIVDVGTIIIPLNSDAKPIYVDCVGVRYDTLEE